MTLQIEPNTSGNINVKALFDLVVVILLIDIYL